MVDRARPWAVVHDGIVGVSVTDVVSDLRVSATVGYQNTKLPSSRSVNGVVVEGGAVSVVQFKTHAVAVNEIVIDLRACRIVNKHDPDAVGNGTRTIPDVIELIVPDDIVVSRLAPLPIINLDAGSMRNVVKGVSFNKRVTRVKINAVVGMIIVL